MTELKEEANLYASIMAWDEEVDTWEDIAERAYIAGAEPREKRIGELEKENEILTKALNLYIDLADECGVAWDNFPDMKEKWWKIVEEKGLGWIEGLTFMAIEEAKEQLKKEVDE